MLDLDSDDDSEGSNYDAKEDHNAMEEDDGGYNGSDLEADQQDLNDTTLGSEENGE